MTVGGPVPLDTLNLSLGVVVIGRNEGERLRACLLSVLSPGRPVVYVDSGSTDGSVATAQSLGADVCRLDMTLPFTAARARNEGFRRLRAIRPGVDVVQFVDGDCEVVPGWLSEAVEFLRATPQVAAVCGRRRERYPERSVYNLLCDLEWNTPVGVARACGGDVAIRAVAMEAVGGFRDELIAGEEPELCIRLRAAGWLIWRLDVDMTRHDAAMTRFAQWWTRATRAGFAYAQGRQLHGGPPERHWVRESRSAVVWGLGLPLLLLSLVALAGPLALVGFLIYPMQGLRLYLKGRGSGRERAISATFLLLGKFAEAAGVVRFHVQRLLRTTPRLIEYK